MDAVIVNQIISGDMKAFKMLFDDYYEKLAYFAFQYLKDKDSAEDVVQELFSNLWINRHKLSVQKSISAYLYGAVRNACLNQLKHRKVKEAYFSTSMTSMDYDSYIPNKIDAEMLDQLIQSCISALPAERQKIFLLSREQDLKYKEIAEKLGISVKTVEAQMGKALRFLRESLKEYLTVFILFFIALTIYF